MNPDGISYLDMASQAVRGGPAGLVNGYWSPLYPGLISVAVWIFRPTAEQEFPLLHMVNGVIFVGTLFSFVFLLRTWFFRKGWTPDGRQIIPLAFLMFLTATTQLVPLALITPDLCVCACVFLVAGICRHLSRRPSARGYAALGLVLGLGYYAKAAMLPIGVLLLGILWIWPLTRPARRTRWLGTAAVVFATTCLPLAVLISQRVGKVSIGETGKLNYAWYVNHLEPRSQGWTDGSELHGAPVHPPRVLMEHPRVLEFASPIGGTYSLWFDPSYWYAGVKTTLQPVQQTRNLFENLRQCGPMASVLLGAVVLALVVLHQQRVVSIAESDVWLVLWPVAVCCLYGTVHVENRFIGGFVAVFWLAVCGYFTVKLKGRAQAAAHVLVAALFLAFAIRGAGHSLTGPAADDLAVASGLRSLGVSPGDRIAVVGDGLFAFYARLTGVRIVAEIPEARDFWKEDCFEAEALEERLRTAGVRLLVASGRPGSYPCQGWREVPEVGASHSSVLFLERH
jgi:hypothetical protein